MTAQARPAPDTFQPRLDSLIPVNRSQSVFIENMGQYPGSTRFYVPDIGGYRLWLGEDQLWLTAYAEGPANEVAATPPALPAGIGVHLKLSFVGANQQSSLEPFNPVSTPLNYLTGQDRINSSAWQGVRYHDLYPGLDLEISDWGQGLEWRLVVRDEQAVASLAQVRLRIEGAETISLPGDDIRLMTAVGERMLPLLQIVAADGQPLPQSGHPPGLTDQEITWPFAPSAAPALAPRRLQASANLRFSTFLGGNDSDCILNCALTINSGGSAYIAGYTYSADFPTTPGSFQLANQGSSDLFVIKLQPDGDELAYATFIGGEAADYATSIAVDSQGSVYLGGYTASSNFPTTATAFNQTYQGGYSDAFVLKLNADGTELIYASLIGGQANDQAAAIAVDWHGNAYLVGDTTSTNFPTTPDALAANLAGQSDGFVVKLNATGTELLYATYLGGSSIDQVQALALDEVGNIFLTGRTTSADFPVTTPAFASKLAGMSDAFVAKLRADGSGLAYATYLGGSSNDQANALAVEATTGQVYLTGSTLSADFPTTATAFDTSHDDGYDAFVAKLGPDGSTLVYSTFLGGSGGDRGQALALDSQGNAYVTGYTYSPDFPIVGAAFDIVQDGTFSDAFVVKLTADGASLAYATFLGGDASEYGTGIAVDGEGSAYIAGATQSTNFPVNRDAFDDSYNGNWDGFVTKLAVGGEVGQTSFAIAGVVRDQDGFAMPGVVLSAGARGSTTTDENGGYTLIGLEEGVYTLTPLKEGYSFSPAQRTVTVPSSEGIQVFTAVADGGPPEPFLDLPFNYGGSASTFIRALRDTGDWGWVTSWFDHAYPDYGKNQNLILWDGIGRTTNRYNTQLGCFASRCYDGHDGIDLIYRENSAAKASQGSVSIQAAAAGVVVLARSGCALGNNSCGNGFGNHVILYHNNGYFTLYGHLNRLSVSNGAAVEAGQEIGIMGSTGNSTGTHLHFGLYRDEGNGRWDGEEVDKPVDPFGWLGTGGDPWVIDRRSPISHYLWRYPLASQETFIGSQGTTMADATGDLQVTVPAGALSGQVSLELFLGPVAGPTSGMRSTGHAFRLGLLEWLPGNNRRFGDAALTTVASALSQALTQPMQFSVAYTDSEMLHLNTNQLTFVYWDEARRTWQNLPTTVDTTTRRVTAQTDAIGNFELQAPLICPADSVEPDDSYFVARSITVDEAPESRLFDISQDEDWFYFEVEAGKFYAIQTLNLAPNVDTKIEIYSRDSSTLQASNDNGGQGLASYLAWRAPQDGPYFIRVQRSGQGIYGCNARYDLQVTEKGYLYFFPFVKN